MGVCATKLKFLNGDVVAVHKVPEHPRSVEEAKQDIVTESEPDNNIVNPEQLSEEKAMAQNTGEPDQTQSNYVCFKVKEIIEDDKVEDHGAKRRSLSLLFKEDQDGSLATEDDKAGGWNRQEPSETEKLIVETVKPVEQVSAD